VEWLSYITGLFQHLRRDYVGLATGAVKALNHASHLRNSNRARPRPWFSMAKGKTFRDELLKT